MKKPSNVVLYPIPSISSMALGSGRSVGARTGGVGVKNPELWQALLAAAAPHNMSWRWVKGHQETS